MHYALNGPTFWLLIAGTCVACTASRGPESERETDSITAGLAAGSGTDSGAATARSEAAIRAQDASIDVYVAEVWLTTDAGEPRSSDPSGGRPSVTVVWSEKLDAGGENRDAQ